MSGQNWSIVIAPSAKPGGPATFTPDLMGAKPGDALQAGNADIISWNNRTPDPHQPFTLGPNGAPLTGLIPPFRSSSPGYVTTASPTGTVVIDYGCNLHPGEFGRIMVFNQ